MKISIITFGVKHRSENTRPKCDVYFDCQTFPNPTGDLYKLNGTQDGVKQFLADRIIANPYYRLVWNQIYNYVINATPQLTDVATLRKTIGLFCLGGRHRSVGTAELLRDTLMEQGFYTLTVSHEDIHKSSRYTYSDFVYKGTCDGGYGGVISMTKASKKKMKQIETSTSEIFDMSKSNASEI